MIFKENDNRNNLEDEFDAWVSKFMTDAYDSMDEDEYAIFCDNIENILAQYTNQDYFDVEDEFEDEFDFDDTTWDYPIDESLNEGKGKGKKFFEIPRIRFYGELDWLDSLKYCRGPYRYICSAEDPDDETEEWDIVENKETGDMFYTKTAYWD